MLAVSPFEWGNILRQICGLVGNLIVWWTGSKVNNQGVSAWSFGLGDDQLRGCTVGNASNARCVYTDAFAHTFNASLTYACPTLLSLPHFYKASSHLHSLHQSHPFMQKFDASRSSRGIQQLVVALLANSLGFCSLLDVSTFV